MKEEEAFNLIANACSKIRMELQGHQVLQQALQVIAKKLGANSDEQTGIAKVGGKNKPTARSS